MPPWKVCPACQKGTFVEEKQETSTNEHGRPLNLYRWFYSCGHVWTVSMIPDPISILENAIKNKNYFEAIVMASAFFENLAIRIVLKHLKNEKRSISQKKLERLTLSELILLLQSCGLIDQRIYTEMVEVKRKRDTLVHYVKPIYQFDEDEAIPLLRKAREVILFLLQTEQKIEGEIEDKETK